jgi:hypothetical protein
MTGNKKLTTAALASLFVLTLSACGGAGGERSGDGEGDEGGASTAVGGGGGTTGSVTGPLMRPGEDCLSCHGFSAAGTVFSGGAGASGVTVTVGGVALASNAAGNFFTQSPITFPAKVSVARNGVTIDMPTPAPSGACNGCHGAAGTPRISAP